MIAASSPTTMTRTLRNLLCGLLLFPGWVFAASPAASPSSFLAALYATPVGTDAVRAYFLVDTLVHLDITMRDSQVSEPDVEALRRELLHGYLAQITASAPPAPPAPPPGAWASLRRWLPGGAKAPADDVAAAIARGHQRDEVLAAPFRAAWQSGLNQAFALRWQDGAQRAPFFTLGRRDMQPIAPGIWAASSASGQLYLMLSLRLANTSTVPLPIYRPDIVLQGMLRFTCSWDRPQKNQNENEANAVTLLQPGAESDLLVCDAPPVPAFWREQLPVLRAATGTAGLQTTLVPHDLDNVQRRYYLERALTDAAPQTDGWRERMLLAINKPHLRWAPAQGALEPPESDRHTGAPQRGWAATGRLLAAFLGLTVLTLGVFIGGRLLRLAGLPRGAVAVATVLAMVGLWLLGTARLSSGGADSSYVGLGLVSIAIGPMLLSVAALHGLHKLLDDEDLAWWQTVATGWRRALTLVAPTSRAEFWGFLAHCAWLWALARVCLVPLDRWVGLVLLVPVLTLCVRRIFSLSQKEWREIGLIVIVLLLYVLLEVSEQL